MQTHILYLFAFLAGLAMVVFLYVFQTSRRAGEDSTGLPNPLRTRFWFLTILVVVLGMLAAFTLPKSPYYFFEGETPAKVIHVDARQFLFVMSEEAIEPGTSMGSPRMTLPAGEMVEFRVTSSDVNHGFAIYDANMKLIAQTQAMPGYVNKLRWKFDTPGEYSVLCLEYCGAAHHVMKATLIVE